ncbi:MAG TPA: phospholipase D family protein [Luteimonas sp.]|nr:phospholipase D family protein [Luteimonas sp.]
MNRLRAWLVPLLALACGACATLSTAQRTRAELVASQARSSLIDCDRADACAQPSPLHALAARAFAESTPAAPRHYALILDYGQDALRVRLNLIRSATTSIELQTYIFDEDDAGHLVLDELMTAARRGVKVRVLVDQLSALKRVDTLAALAGAHTGFAIRIYNPVLGRARINYPQYLLAAACCWRKLNQRMHSKLLLIDGAVGISGGRNYQDDYYDWDASYNFRDRDVLVAGPVVRSMAENFDTFWNDRRSVPAERLADVGGLLLREGVPELAHATFERPQRVAAMSRDADDPALLEKLSDAALPVSTVEFIADLPQKHRRSNEQPAPASTGLRALIESAHDEVLLQTPYLVLSEPAQQMFRALRRRQDPPRVIISTASLASTDSFMTYALSYKYKRRYLRDFGFEIHEFKPFPKDVPVDVDATGALTPKPAGNDSPVGLLTPSGSVDGSSGGGEDEHILPLQREYAALRYSGFAANEPVPLQRAGVRIGLHSKSLVVDERIGVVGTHNFDPRGDRYNTESAVVIDDPAFAHALAQSIRRDIAPGNSWTIARRDSSPIFPGLEYQLAKISERLPIFDLWPVRYATSYEFQPGPQCPVPLPPTAPDFRACYRPVGDFPEVSLGLKSLLTRIFTAFGAGLAPVL